jgi:hypothetical protein
MRKELRRLKLNRLVSRKARVRRVVTEYVPCVADHARGIHPVTVALSDTSEVISISSPCVDGDHLACVEAMGNVPSCVRVVQKIRELLTSKPVLTDHRLVEWLPNHYAIRENARQARARRNLVSEEKPARASIVASTIAGFPVVMLSNSTDRNARALALQVGEVIVAKRQGDSWDLSRTAIEIVARRVRPLLVNEQCLCCQMAVRTQSSHLKSEKHFMALWQAIARTLAAFGPARGFMSKSYSFYAAPRLPRDPVREANHGGA